MVSYGFTDAQRGNELYHEYRSQPSYAPIKVLSEFFGLLWYSAAPADEDYLF
jgi:hypothetical protein